MPGVEALETPSLAHGQRRFRAESRDARASGHQFGILSLLIARVKDELPLQECWTVKTALRRSLPLSIERETHPPRLT